MFLFFSPVCDLDIGDKWVGISVNRVSKLGTFVTVPVSVLSLVHDP